MASPISFGTLQVPGAPIEPAKSESPFRIAVVADFTGRTNRGVTGVSKDIAARRLLRVTRENLDEIMTKLGVSLHLPAGPRGQVIALPFKSLDDFHPDQIHDRVTPIADAYDSEEKSALMNAVLHHPDFQALESAWRGLDWLIGRAAKGKVEVLLADVSFEEMWGDLKTHENLANSALNHLLIEKSIRGPQGQPLAAIVANYTFYLSAPYIEILGRFAKIANRANAPLLTTLGPQVLDPNYIFSAEDTSAWQALRNLPEASIVGVPLPRFLLRQPYGENTRSIDRFALEEVSIPPDRSHYLWGTPALACAALLAQGFHKAGWAAKPGEVLDVEDLPVHVYSQDGEEEVVVGEAWLDRPMTEQLGKKGLMSLLTVRGMAAMQLLRFQSLAQPAPGQQASELRGHWTQPGMTAVATRPGVPLGPKVSMVSSPTGMPAAAATSGVSLASLQQSAATPAPRQAPPPPVQAPVAVAPPPVQAPVAAPVQAPAAAPPPAEEPLPVEEEMDPDLAAMLKELE